MKKSKTEIEQILKNMNEYCVTELIEKRYKIKSIDQTVVTVELEHDLIFTLWLSSHSKTVKQWNHGENTIKVTFTELEAEKLYNVFQDEWNDVAIDRYNEKILELQSERDNLEKSCDDEN